MLSKGLDVLESNEHVVLARLFFGVVGRKHFCEIADLHSAVRGVWCVSEHYVSRLDGRVAASFTATDDASPHVSCCSFFGLCCCHNI